MTEEKIFERLRGEYKINVELELAALAETTLNKYIDVEEFPKMNILRSNVVKSGENLADFERKVLDQRAADIIKNQLRKRPPFG